MDLLDIEILRQFYPDGQVHFFWRDPRTSLPDIGKRVGLSPSATRRRMQGWIDHGFLCGYDAWPHPRLFGVELATCLISLREWDDPKRIFAELRLVEGVISACDGFDLGRRSLLVHFVADTPTATARRTKLLARLGHPHGLGNVRLLAMAPGPERLSHLEWRIVAAVRRWCPTRWPFRAIPEAGVSRKTFAKHYRALMERNALYWVPHLDFSRLPAVWLHVCLDGSEVSSRVRRELDSRFPHWLPTSADEWGGTSEAQVRGISGLFPADTPGVAEDVLEEVYSIPGVERVTRHSRRRVDTFEEWFDQRVGERLRGDSDLPVTSRLPEALSVIQNELQITTSRGSNVRQRA